MKDLEQTYHLFFGNEPVVLSHLFSPYAICPLGAHVDHQHGVVSGFALDHGIDFLYSPTLTGKCELASLSFGGLMTFNVRQPMYEHQHNWGDYVRAALWALQRGGHQLQYGVRCILRGSIPSGGVASSAALQCGFITILARVNGLHLTGQQIIEYASMAERLYIGLNNGILDQACVVLSQPHQLLYIDTNTSEHRLQQFDGLAPDTSLPFCVGVFYSGLSQALTTTDYNLRVQECRTSAWMLHAYAEQPLQKLEESHLRDVDEEVFRRYAAQMPRRFACRARHYFEECQRVRLGAEAWRRGDIRAFGQLMFESCESSINNYECGAPELISLYHILHDTDGVLGARFSGSGFLGSCIALIDVKKAASVVQHVTAAYAEACPQYKDAFQAFVCHSGHGIQAA